MLTNAFQIESAILADSAWPGTAMAFGLAASQIIGLGLLLEWLIIWRAFGLSCGRAAVATLVVNLVTTVFGIPFAWGLGGVLASDGFGAMGFLVLAALLSGAIEIAVLERAFGVKATSRNLAWMMGANLLSCVIVTALFLLLFWRR